MHTAFLFTVVSFCFLSGPSVAGKEKEQQTVQIEWVQPDLEPDASLMIPIGNNMFAYHPDMDATHDEYDEDPVTDDPLFIQHIVDAAGVNQQDEANDNDGMLANARGNPTIVNWLKYLQQRARPDFAVVKINGSSTTGTGHLYPSVGTHLRPAKVEQGPDGKEVYMDLPRKKGSTTR